MSKLAAFIGITTILPGIGEVPVLFDTHRKKLLYSLPKSGHAMAGLDNYPVYGVDCYPDDRFLYYDDYCRLYQISEDIADEARLKLIMAIQAAVPNLELF